MKTLLILTILICSLQPIFAQDCCNSNYRGGDIRVVDQKKGTPGPDKQFSEDFVLFLLFPLRHNLLSINSGFTRSAIKAPQGNWRCMAYSSQTDLFKRFGTSGSDLYGQGIFQCGGGQTIRQRLQAKRTQLLVQSQIEWDTV